MQLHIFVIFNPITQGLKFDPKGEICKKIYSRIKGYSFLNQVTCTVGIKFRRSKKFKCIIGKDYPKPIVNLSESRDKALKLFHLLKKCN